MANTVFDRFRRSIPAERPDVEPFLVPHSVDRTLPGADPNAAPAVYVLQYDLGRRVFAPGLPVL